MGTLNYGLGPLFCCFITLFGARGSLDQALAGSRDFKSAKIPGFLKLKSRDFLGFFVTMFMTPWNALKPKIAEIAKNLFTFPALPSLYLLMERGQNTKTNTKYKTNQFVI